MGKLTKMKIVAFSDGKYQEKVTHYQVMMNPESIKWGRTIEYNNSQAPDSGKPSSKYKKSPAQSLSFDLVVDCTGVVDSKRLDLLQDIQKLKETVYSYDGNIHRPNFVSIHWGGKFLFQGILTNYDTSYEYFKPNGDPLRAKISLKFISYTDVERVTKQEKKKSPDMTHLVQVVAGVSLPQLSQKIYNTPDYMVQVAESNGLNKFRHLIPGSELRFPPIRTGTR